MKKVVKKLIVVFVVISLVGLGVLTKKVYDRVFSTIGRIDHEGIVTIDPENEDFETFKTQVENLGFGYILYSSLFSGL